MKKGFLNTQKAKKRVAEAVDSEAADSKSKDKKPKRDSSHQDAEHIDMSTLDPHALPKSIRAQSGSRTRVVFRTWPRDPNGEIIRPSPLRGKEAGNGLDLWGATLYDFYYVNRMPSVTNFITTSTSSRLAKWMRQAGELFAKDELAWTDNEEDPKEIPVASMGELIQCRDTRVEMGMYDRWSSRKEVRELAENEHSRCSSSAAGTEDEEDSIPLVNDQSGDVEKSAIPSAQLDDPMAEDEAAANSPENGADKSSASVLQHDESMQEDKTSDYLLISTDESSDSASHSDEPMPLDETGDKPSTEGANKPAVPISKDSPFHPDNYPSPWPFIPCSIDDPPPTLQQRIPLHLLPQKLHVHDPWNCLSINRAEKDHKTPWLTKVTKGRDIIRTYSLSLSEEGKQAASASKEKAELTEDEAAAETSAMRIFPADKEGPTDEPLIDVVFPSRPRKRMHLEEAHLYIAPPELGSGNHSLVYLAEWELPRDLFTEPKLCKVCIEEDTRKQIQALKDQGKWEELFQGLTEEAQAVGPDTSEPSSSHAPPKRMGGHITIEERWLPHETASFVCANGRHPKAPRNTGDGKTADETVADAVMNTATDIVETGRTETDVEMDIVEHQHEEPGDEGGSKEPNTEGNGAGEGNRKRKRTLDQDDESEETQGGDKSSEEESGEEVFTVRPPRVVRLASYTGLAVRISSNVKWQNLWGPWCSHMNVHSPDSVPRTEIVSVVAKLSIEHDAHLARESINYQKFPSHFFEHWNGYNVIPPLKDPVPVGAVCPQYYGYYTPDDPTDGKQIPHYLSPILLLEHCGSPVVPEEMNVDDRQECASLLFRFHHAGWLHQSFAERNILRQKGKPTQWPLERMITQHNSFRLIDFGRSKMLEDSSSRMLEEESGLRLFHLHHWDNGMN